MRPIFNAMVPKTRRKQSGFQVVDTATDIYWTVLAICIRMPKRYTDLVLDPIVSLAGEVMDEVIKGNSAIPNASAPDPTVVKIRKTHFTEALSSLEALIQRMNFFIANPNMIDHEIIGRSGTKIRVRVTEAQLIELAELMRKEITLIRGTIKKDEERFNTGCKL